MMFVSSTNDKHFEILKIIFVVFKDSRNLRCLGLLGADCASVSAFMFRESSERFGDWLNCCISALMARIFRSEASFLVSSRDSLQFFY